jgi:hypothetical protein
LSKWWLNTYRNIQLCESCSGAKSAKIGKNMKHKLYIIVLSLFVAACSSQNKGKSADTPATIVSKPTHETKPANKTFSYQEIAKYAIASIMNRPVTLIRSEQNGDEFRLSYVRASDGKSFSYKIKFEGNKIVWGSSDGRWRDTTSDEVITFREVAKKLEIVQTYSDGSESVNDYSK